MSNCSLFHVQMIKICTFMLVKRKFNITQHCFQSHKFLTLYSILKKIFWLRSILNTGLENLVLPQAAI